LEFGMRLSVIALLVATYHCNDNEKDRAHLVAK
jgi:hypothetical protein